MSILLALLGLSIPKLIGIVALGVAAGILIAKIAMLTFSWLTNKIKQKLAKRNVSKVAVAEIQEIINNTKNQVTIDELEAMQEKGITHFSVDIQDDGKIEQNGIELWNVENEDEQTRELINRTGEGIVVING